MQRTPLQELIGTQQRKELLDVNKVTPVYTIQLKRSFIQTNFMKRHSTKFKVRIPVNLFHSINIIIVDWNLNTFFKSAIYMKVKIV